jgi:hypothetical protein
MSDTTIYLVQYTSDEKPVHCWYSTVEEAHEAAKLAKSILASTVTSKEILDSFDNYVILSYNLEVQ